MEKDWLVFTFLSCSESLTGLTRQTNAVTIRGSHGCGHRWPGQVLVDVVTTDLVKFSLMWSPLTWILIDVVTTDLVQVLMGVVTTDLVKFSLMSSPLAWSSSR
ncbi:hypothetical protein Btru_071610 [Bulinus truncatus]|nr:hypothetical protein Btru_071610 [Bulinus truncatus]